MTQVCPSPSLELEAAAAAFRKARQKFPSNARNDCSGDAERYPLQVYPMSLSKNKRRDSNPPTDRYCVPNNRPRETNATFPSISSSRTASWSHDCRIRQRNREVGLKELCDACGGRRDCSQTPKELIISDMEDCIKEAASKSMHSSVGTKRRRHPRHRRPCVHVGGRNQTEEQICLLHGFPAATRRRSSIPRKPQNQRHCDYKESSLTGGKVDHLMADEERDKIYCSDSPTLTDFPTKLQNWEYRTHRESRRLARHDPVVMQKLASPKDKILNREAMCNSCIRETENSTRNGSKKGQKPSSDVCLRPSLIKAAQRRVDGLRSHKSFNLCGDASKHSNSKSAWDENLPIINHKDSMSILMDRFRGNEKNRSLKLQNISELNSVLGSKTSCGEGGGGNQSFDDEESIDLNFPARKSSSGVNPVRKLGRVANQGLRENESKFKNLRARLNRSGICCSSPKETACRRAF